MQQKLPVFIAPERFAKGQQSLSGELSLSKMPRLRSVLPEQDQVVTIQLQFGYDADHRVVIDLSIKTQLTLECQRTMEPYTQDFNIQVRLAPIHEDSEAALLPTEYEPLLLNHQDQFALIDVVEDELLLSQPIIPKQ